MGASIADGVMSALTSAARGSIAQLKKMESFSFEQLFNSVCCGDCQEQRISGGHTPHKISLVCFLFLHRNGIKNRVDPKIYRWDAGSGREP